MKTPVPGPVSTRVNPVSIKPESVPVAWPQVDVLVLVEALPEPSLDGSEVQIASSNVMNSNLPNGSPLVFLPYHDWPTLSSDASPLVSTTV